MDKKTHEAYRVGSNFEQVVKNIKELCREKQKRKSRYPIIDLQFVVMKANEKQIPQVIKLAKDLAVDQLSLKTVSLGSTISLKEQISRSAKYLPKNLKLSRYRLINGRPVVNHKPVLCDWIKKAVIYWNGDVSTCCYDFSGLHTIGNIFEYGNFKKLWFSYAYAKARKQVLEKKLPLCRKCSMPMDYGITMHKDELKKINPENFLKTI